MDISKLSAGADFAQYLIDNGWQLTALEVGNRDDKATFVKGKDKIEYSNSYEALSTFTHYKEFLHNRYYQHNEVNGPDLEADVLKFAFLCHAMDWVSFKDAKLTVTDANGTSVSKHVRSLFCTSTFEAKQIANEIFETVE